jgi:hypothetical protein
MGLVNEQLRQQRERGNANREKGPKQVGVQDHKLGWLWSVDWRVGNPENANYKGPSRKTVS